MYFIFDARRRHIGADLNDGPLRISRRFDTRFVLSSPQRSIWLTIITHRLSTCVGKPAHPCRTGRELCRLYRLHRPGSTGDVSPHQRGSLQKNDVGALIACVGAQCVQFGQEQVPSPSFGEELRSARPAIGHRCVGRHSMSPLVWVVPSQSEERRRPAREEAVRDPHAAHQGRGVEASGPQISSHM